MTNFPNDLTENLLSRLPVKSLLRFKSVSKHWYSLITSKHFTKLHKLTQSFPNQPLLLHHYTHLNTTYPIKTINSINSINIASLSSQPIKLNLQLPILNVNNSVFKLLGSCDGLLCLFVSDVVIIWNLATRKHAKLPAINVENPFPELKDVDIVCGFGYDSGTDDYKVLMLVQFYEGDWESFRSVANVFSLKLGSWRRVSGFENYRVSSKQARMVFSCGGLHWFIIKGNGSESDFDLETVIASFDLATEECRVIEMPELGDHGGEASLVLGELGGCLSVVCNFYEAGIVDVWVMNDYEAKLWTKLFTVGLGVVESFEHLIPLGYSENREEVLLVVNFVKLLWYDIKKKTSKVVDVCGVPKPFYPVVCSESLVSVGETSENDEKRGEEDEGGKGKQPTKFLSKGFKLVL